MRILSSAGAKVHCCLANDNVIAVGESETVEQEGKYI